MPSQECTPWSWSVFLAGPPLAHEGLYFWGRTSSAVVLSGLPCAPSGLRRAHGCALADGGARQPLFVKTEVVCHEKAQQAEASDMRTSMLWVGDRDSLSAEEDETLQELFESDGRERIVLPRDKALSDGAALMAEILRRDVSPSGQCRVMEFCGALGGRRDQESLFLAELVDLVFHQHPCPAGTCLVLQPELVISDVPVEVRDWQGSDVVSIACSSSQGAVGLRGLAYEGEFVLERPSYGLSNRIKGSNFCVIPPQGAFCTIFLNGKDVV